MSLVASAGKVLIEVFGRGLSAYCEAKRQVSEEQCRFRTDHDHGHDVCGSQAAGIWAESKNASPHVLHQSSEDVRHR